MFGNIIGAFLAFLYFTAIRQPSSVHPDIPPYYHILYFIIGTAFLVGIASIIIKRMASILYEVADGGVSIESLDEISARRAKRSAIQFPPVMAGLTLLIWILAGFIFALLQPLFTQMFFGVEPPGLTELMVTFFGIVVLGGSITSLFIYFSTESMWRKALPKFFPEGELDQVSDSFKLNVRIRLLVVFLAISLIPLPILGLTAYSKAQALHTADAVARTQIMSSLLVQTIFIIAISVITSLLLSFFVSKSVSTPLEKLAHAISEVEKENLNVQMDIVSNDEIGKVTEGFNRMVKGLKKSELLKESFGKYLSEEIRDEILSGRVSLDGEMKRVTLLFSDLRDFTTLVENTHPTKVVTILNQYFTEMTSAIKIHRGQVLQYVGDEIEAVFGAPVAYDDHPDMAVRAALEMRKRLIVLNQRLEKQGFKPLRHGIGIHTGAVLAGNIGSKDRVSYALVGDTVNLASRIEGLTKTYSWDIILSQTSHDLLIDTFPTEQLSAVKLKGKKEEVMIYKLLDQA